MRWLDGDGEGGGDLATKLKGRSGQGGNHAAGNHADLRRLRTGLDLAADRTDELALRRVWGRVVDLPLSPPRRRGPMLLGGLCLVAAGLAATGFALSLRIAEVSPPVARVVTTPPPPEMAYEDPVPVLLGPATLQTGAAEFKRVRLKGGALISVAAQSTLTVDAGQRPSLARGHINLEVPRQPPGEQFTVEAGPYMIVVVGTKFDVGKSARQVNVSVTEGIVEVWRDGKMVRLKAGHSWRGPLQGTTARQAKLRERSKLASVSRPFTQHPGDRFEQAKLALATGDAAGGLVILRELATGNGPIAENSGYEIGLVLRDRLHFPREAIEAWKQYRQRFPRGLLRAEADLSVVETELELGAHEAARAEAEAFLRRHPRSERRREVEALVQRLARAEAAVVRKAEAIPAAQAPAAQAPPAQAAQSPPAQAAQSPAAQAAHAPAAQAAHAPAAQAAHAPAAQAAHAPAAQAAHATTAADVRSP